jgi:predicted Ser/Thr protein kinase
VNLGRYEVVRELGKGAMGIVYLARDPLIGRLVALKTIRLADSGDEEEVREFQQRFIREAQAAGILSHPAIVTVHDIGQDDQKGFSFIAMEYVEGPTLKEVLQQGRQLSHPSIARILVQVAEALDFAHSKGIVHRDVKPANIILCGDEKVKITDFGIAKIASEAVNLTTTGQFLGTPNYMAPEQVKGSSVDGRTDVFALGVVLYELLTRRKPFGGDSLTTISYRIVHEPFETPHEVDPSIPIEFDEVVNRCLAKDPRDRYQHARDVAADLRALAAGQPLPPPPAEPAADPTVVGGKVPTMELPFPEAAGAAGAAAGAPGAARTSPGEGTLRKAMRRRIPPVLFFAVIVALLAGVGVAAGWIWSQRTPVPVVDQKREGLVARQSQLRREGHALLGQGNVEGAYAKFSELQRLAPSSPGVAKILGQLEQIRGEQVSTQQRIRESQEKLAEGKTLYDAKQYAKAIPVFEEAFNLDSSSVDAVNYLRMSREQLALRQLREADRLAAAQVAAAPAPRGPEGAATLVVEYAGDLTDGVLMVQLDGEKIAHEALYEDRGVFRRRGPREVNLAREIQSGKHEIVVFAVVAGMRITERKVFDQEFQSGGTYRIRVRFDRNARRFDIQMV